MSSRSTFTSTRSAMLDTYAADLNVSSDGARTAYDLDYRSAMLKSIAKAHDHGLLK